MREPQQRDLLTRRWRKVKILPPREDRVQMDVVAYFRVMRVAGSVCIHIANQEMRKERFGKLLAMGAYPGAADLLFLRVSGWSLDLLPEVLFLEMKRLGEKPSDKQLAFGKAVRVCGAHYEYADSKQLAIEILEKYGFVRPDRNTRGSSLAKQEADAA